MANKFWLGIAGGTAHAYTATIAATWAGADTATVSINSKDVTITVATGETSTNEVAAALSAAINASDATSDLAGAETRNVGGQQYPEFAELKATVLSNKVTITHKELGVPFTLTATRVTAGSGTNTGAVSVTSTGPMHYDNPSNWSGGSLPVDLDVVVFNAGSMDCSYGLTYALTNTDDLSFLRTTDYTGTIGLPAINKNGYHEYRERFLKMYDQLDAMTILFERGNKIATGGPTYLNLQSQTYASLFARDCGTIVEGRPNLSIHGGTVSDMYLGRGSVLIDPDDANQTAGCTIDALEIGGIGLDDNGTQVVLGRLTAWASGGTTSTVKSGNTIMECALDQGTPELTLVIQGGEVHARGDGSLTDPLTIQDGTFHWDADGDIAGTVNVWSDGTLDLTGDGRTHAFSGTINVYDGSTVRKGGHTPTLTPLGCTLEDVNVTA